MSFSAWRGGLALVPGLLGVLAAADAPALSKTVKLSQTGVPVPGAVMTPSVLAAGNRGGFWMQMVSRNGVILPAQRATFGQGQGETTAAVGGVSLNLLVSRENRTFSLKPEKGAPVPLKQQGDGLAPTVLPLPDKRKLPLAFPYAYVGRGESFIAMRAAATAKGSLDGDQIHLLDDDLDGSLGDRDVIAVGPSFCFAPIAKRLATRKGVWAISAIAADGGSLTVQPDEAATVPVTCAFTGISAGHIAIASADGSLTAVATGAKDVLRLPPGDYKLLHGVVADGKGKVMAAMVPGEFKPVTVASDADPKTKTVFAYGGPFNLRFTAKLAGGKLNVSPLITLHGAGGEQYIDYRWQGPPAVYVNGRQNGAMGFG